MNLTKELMTQLVQVVIDKKQAPSDVLWCVTSLRTNIFCLFRNLRLSRPGPQPDPVPFDLGLGMEVFFDFACVLSTFPAEIKYNDDNVETPRRNALDRAFEVAQGLTSDEDTWNSAQELVRLVATNSDSEHQKLDYAVLMGIMLKIFELVGIDAGQVCYQAIDYWSKKAEA